MEQPIEPQDSTTLPDVEETQTEEQETSTEPETTPEVDPEKQKLLDTNKQLYARLKKLEAKETAPQQTKKETALSTSDVLTLVSSNITNEDDINTITDAAKALGLSIKDAVKNPTIKSILLARQEERKTAEATNTTVSRRGAAKLSDDTLYSNAKKGIMPDSDEDLARLHDIRKKRG